MKKMWKMTIDDYLNICDIAREIGMKPGDDLSLIVEIYMKEKGEKPFGLTEWTKEELIEQLMLKSKKMLHIQVDDSGKQSYKLIKRKDD